LVRRMVSSGETGRNEGGDEGEGEQRQQKSKGLSTTRNEQGEVNMRARATDKWRRMKGKMMGGEGV
jgi:hypothetical protein